MMRRMWKELLALRFYWLGLLAAYLIGWAVMERGTMRSPRPVTAELFFSRFTQDQLSLIRDSNEHLYFGIFVALGLLQLLTLHWLAVCIFGSEFQDNAIGRLLAQPLKRGRIWGEKILALLVIISACLAANLLLSAGMLHRVHGIFVTTLPDNMGRIYTAGLYSNMKQQFIGELLLPFVLFTIGGGLLALANGSLMAILLRQTYTAFWAALVFPLFCMISLVVLDHWVFMKFFSTSLFEYWESLLPNIMHSQTKELEMYTSLGMVWFTFILALSWLSFKRLEV